MRPQKLTGFCIEHRFDHTFGFAECDGFTVADKRETTDFHVISQFLGFCLGIADRGHLGIAIGTAGDAFRLDRMYILSGDHLGYHDAFV